MNRAVLALSLLLAGAMARAETTGTLAGHVADPSGGALPGATLTARHLETGHVRVGTSDRTGAFVLPKLPVGPYGVRAEVAGFPIPGAPRGGPGGGQSVVRRLTLEPGGVTEEVTVCGRRAVLYDEPRRP